VSRLDSCGSEHLLSFTIGFYICNALCAFAKQAQMQISQLIKEKQRISWQTTNKKKERRRRCLLKRRKYAKCPFTELPHSPKELTKAPFRSASYPFARPSPCSMQKLSLRQPILRGAKIVRMWMEIVKLTNSSAAFTSCTSS